MFFIILSEVEFVLLIFISIVALVYKKRVKEKDGLISKLLDAQKEQLQENSKLSSQTDDFKRKLKNIKNDLNNLQRYKALYSKLDDHIQSFSNSARSCLESIMQDSPDEAFSTDAHQQLDQLMGILSKLNPIPHKDKSLITIFGDKKNSKDLSSPPKKQQNKLNELGHIISNQRQLILDLKHKIEQSGSGYPDSIKILEGNLQQAEHYIRKLEDELFSEKSLSKAHQTVKEQNKSLQSRIQILEDKERKLESRLTEYKNKYTEQSITQEQYHEMEQKISSMQSLIKEKETAIVQYKSQKGEVEQEYDRLFQSYTNALQKHGAESLDEIDITKLGDDEMLELQETKALLASKETELQRVKDECCLLEESYLDLSNHIDSFKSAQKEIDALIIERDALTKELENITKAGKDNEQFKEENIKLRKKCKALQVKIDKYSHLPEKLKRKEDELDRLRIEFTMMEEQYLDSQEYILDKD